MLEMFASVYCSRKSDELFLTVLFAAARDLLQVQAEACLRLQEGRRACSGTNARGGGGSVQLRQPK